LFYSTIKIHFRDRSQSLFKNTISELGKKIGFNALSKNLGSFTLSIPQPSASAFQIIVGQNLDKPKVALNYTCG